MAEETNFFEIQCQIPELDSLRGIDFDYDAPERDLLVSTGLVYKVSPIKCDDNDLEKFIDSLW